MRDHGKQKDGLGTKNTIRNDRSDRIDRIDRSDRNDRNGRSDRIDRIDRSDRNDRNDRIDRIDRNDRIDRIDRKDLILYAVTDRQWLNGAALSHQATAAIRGGITCLQLREKDLPPEAFLAEALKIKKICNQAGVPFIINDDVELGLACGADGVHVGQSDAEAGSARRRLGKDRILGVSVRTVEEAAAAEKAGADYLGVGAMFPTGTKKDARPVTFQTLKDICQAVSIPAVAIGGITPENMDQLKGSGVAGVALVSAIFAEVDIEDRCRRLLAQAKELFL